MSDVAGHELHGSRVGEWPAGDLVDLWGRVCSAVVKHGFVIELRDLEPPRTGIFDGLRIVLDPDVSFEMQSATTRPSAARVEVVHRQRLPAGDAGADPRASSS
jgi:hypothetical protein